MTEEHERAELREKIIAVICEEWPTAQNELENTYLLERLRSEGEEVSEHRLRSVLVHLADRGDITFVLESSTGMTVRDVKPELCQ